MQILGAGSQLLQNFDFFKPLGHFFPPPPGPATWKLSSGSETASETVRAPPPRDGLYLLTAGKPRQKSRVPQNTHSANQ